MSHHRVGRAALTCAVGATLLLGLLGQGTARAAGSLTVSPSVLDGRVAEVTISGSCPGVSDPDGIAYPPVRVSMEGGRSVNISRTGASFSGSFPLPDVVPPGTYTFSASMPSAPDETPACDPTDTLTVVPVLRLSADSAVAGDEVQADGTCPPRTGDATLFLGNEALTSAPVSSRTGSFGPVPFTVPEGIEAGDVRITSSCGAAAPFTVRAPSVPPTSPQTATPTSPPATGAPSSESSSSPSSETSIPPGSLVVVPDLTGMTEDEAVAALGESLVLGNPSGRDGRVQTQTPPPGTLVQPASAVSVVLEPTQSLLWLLIPAVLVLAAAVGGLVSRERVRRRRAREKRWVEEHVGTEFQPQAAVLAHVSEEALPGLDLRLEVHRHPARL